MPLFFVPEGTFDSPRHDPFEYIPATENGDSIIDFTVYNFSIIPGALRNMLNALASEIAIKLKGASVWIVNNF